MVLSYWAPLYMSHQIECFAIVVFLSAKQNYFVPTKFGCLQTFFPGLQEPATLETDYGMVVIFLHFPHAEQLHGLQSHLPTWPQAPLRAEAKPGR